MSKNGTTSEKIIDAATELIAAKGFSNVSMRDIASKADVALSMLTYHFITKENLFRCVAEQTVSSCIDEINKIAESNDSSAEYFPAVVKYFQSPTKEKYDAMKILVDFSTQSLWSSGFKQHLNDYMNNVVTIIRKKVLAKKDAQIFGNYSMQAITSFILSFMFGLSLNSLSSDGNTSPNEFIELSKDFYKKYLTDENKHPD